MNKEEIQSYLSSNFPELSFPEIVSSLLNVACDRNQLINVCERLKKDDSLQLDFLFCQTAVDREENMEVVYHLRSSGKNHELVLRTSTENRSNPEVASVVGIWATAEFHEREIYDLFGIVFTDHPDLRRIFLDDDWKGFPLRKDYVDEVNIIDL